MKIHGWDLSLNHAGFVEMDEAGRVTWFRFVTDKVTLAKPKLGGLRMPVGKHEDKMRMKIARLAWWGRFFNDTMADLRPTHVAIEDYAMRAMSNSSYQIGELGGAARLAVLKMGAALRLHDPLSVKMYIAHDGTTPPEGLADAVFDRWPKTKVWENLGKDPKLDLCVAFGLARMCLDEVRIRAGKLKLSDLHAKEIQVFHRVTKANPVNLLGREFITGGEL